MFWDGSALVPLLVEEKHTAALTAALGRDDQPAMWWAGPVECLSALHRSSREGRLDAGSLEAAMGRLAALVEDMDTVVPTDIVREKAGRLLAVHPIRAADALQLAAALVWCRDRTQGEGFACLDGRLRLAARLEGFRIVPRQ